MKSPIWFLKPVEDPGHEFRHGMGILSNLAIIRCIGDSCRSFSSRGVPIFDLALMPKRAIDSVSMELPVPVSYSQLRRQNRQKVTNVGNNLVGQ